MSSMSIPASAAAQGFDYATVPVATPGPDLQQFAEVFGPMLIARAKRTPYFHLDGYMNRYWLMEPGSDLGISIRVHQILRSDIDSALHDHPWPNASLVLAGTYYEIEAAEGHAAVDPMAMPYPLSAQEPAVIRQRVPGSFVMRKANTRHRLVLNHGEVWSLFVMWPKEQEWGFYARSEGRLIKVLSREYLNTIGQPDPPPDGVIRARPDRLRQGA